LTGRRIAPNLGVMTNEEPLNRAQDAIDEATKAAARAGDLVDTPAPPAGQDDAESLDPRQEPPA